MSGALAPAGYAYLIIVFKLLDKAMAFSFDCRKHREVDKPQFGPAHVAFM